MVIGLVPGPVMAENGDIQQISKKEYAIAPGITEYELVTNNSELSAQQVGHIMEVDLQSGYADIIAGYNDYNIEAIASGNNWGMRKPTEQAQNAETRRNVNVVGAVNGDFFNMSNGAPSGTLVMQGTPIKSGTTACFWIDSENKAHISANNADMNKEADALGVTVQEAIGGNPVLIQNGEKTVSGNSYDDTANPRTSVGIKSDGTVVIYMVNGRQAPYSVGMSCGELADIMLELGCETAMNLDGGGSSVFATQREGEENNNGTAGLTIRCRPSDGYERSVSSSLLVVSKAERTGAFDHATLSPQDEVYTPGSQIQFEAKGVDIGGGPAALPGSGLSWQITEGSDKGTIDSATGLFTAAENVTGTVRVALSYQGAVVGETAVELQWPDQIEFFNTSVSLDFGETSDLSFNPTYEGRTVHYKDGDFEWSVVDDDELSYKHSLPVEIYTKPGWGPYDQQLQVSLTGGIGKIATATAYYNNYLVYETAYEETSRDIISSEDGTISVTETITHKGAKLYSHSDGTLLKDNITEDVNEFLGGYAQKVTGIEAVRETTFSLGQFQNNQFIADENTSLKGRIKVALKDKEEVSAIIDVVVGMEPYVLMDFEDGHIDPITQNELSAEEYWTLYIGESQDVPDTSKKNGQLSLREREKYRLWLRDTTGKGVVWPKNGDGSYVAGLVNSEEEGKVRFGSHALKLAWDFTKVPKDQVAAADFGFSSLIYAHVVQPTKIGFWINVPASLSEDESQVKMIFVGGITNIEDTAEADAQKPGQENAYWDMDADGNLTWHPHKLPKGTTQYLNYYSYDAEGNVTGERLKDWAGDGWTWIEADLSSAQFPIGIQYGYTIRIVSPQNYAKEAGEILIDNLQLIYGTNTNDVNNPVISSVTERSSGTSMSEGELCNFESNDLAFEVAYDDSELVDKYASGIDISGIHVYLDGVDYTGSAEIGPGSLNVAAAGLTNGSHSLRVVIKDLFGNETSKTYPFVISDPAGADAGMQIAGQEEAPSVGGTYTLKIESSDPDITKATIAINVLPDYASEDMYGITAGDGYKVEAKLNSQDNQIVLTIEKTGEGQSGEMAEIRFSIPDSVRENESFRYSVPMAVYETGAGNLVSFSLEEVSISFASAYTVDIPMALQGMETEILVTDASEQPVAGAEIFCDGQSIGTTNAEGALAHVFTDAGRKTVYAQKDGMRSWNTDFVVNTISGEGPFDVQNNGTEDGATSRNITWLSPIKEGREAVTQLRLSDQDGEWDAAEVYEGTGKMIAFTETNSGTALRLNQISLNGLEPKTTYYYQVSDGEDWSNTYSFTTSSNEKDGATNFFVFGDIQTDSTANLASAIEKVASGEIAYDFGIQTGDAVDNVTAFSNWRGYLTVLNGRSLDGIDVIHTLGNHEYYGDADGDIAGSIFSIPETEPGNAYFAEYGSVFVAVVNNGGDLKAALEQVKAKAAESDCIWKVLSVHEPIYGTVEEMDPETRGELTQLIEDAGIDFVFTGDDHAYARTYPLKGGQQVASEEGVVYYICGDLSGKSNEFHKYDYFAEAIPHETYQGMYLSVQADSGKMTITAYDYNGDQLDQYTKERGACEQGNHTFGEESLYDLEQGTITCEVCQSSVPAKESQYTGVSGIADSEGKVMLRDGELVKGEWFALGEDICHAGTDGILHETKTTDTATCTKNGRLTAQCLTCGQSYEGAATWAKGHVWDDKHVCQVCGREGIDIAEAELEVEYLYYSYTGSPIRPASTATYDGRELVASSDRYGTDAYISYENNTNVGVATVTYEGRGDFYGEVSGTFTIVPASVATVKADSIGMDSITLGWDKAPGAERYCVDQLVNGQWKHSWKTTDTSYTVSNLEPKTEYTFRVHSLATVDGKEQGCLKYSEELTVSTTGDPQLESATYITRIAANVGGQEIKEYQSGSDRYLFLPSDADLSGLTVRIVVSDEKSEDSLKVNGQEVSKNTESIIDVEGIGTQTEDGAYDLSIQLNDLNPVTVTVMKSANINTMYLTSANPETEGRDYVDAEKGNSAVASMQMVSSEGNQIYSGELSQLKSRGNSTFLYYPKKSYQIKLDQKTDLLGSGEEVKTWVLLAGYGDATQIHDKLFKDLSLQLGMAYTPSCQWLDLYYDGEYRGTYLLSEKNSIGGDAVDITDMEKAYEDLYEDYGNNATTAEGTNTYGQSYSYTEGLAGPEDLTGGYLLELNHNTIDEANGFHTRQDVAFNIKSPEYGSKEAVQYISEYYQEFEDAVYATDAEGNYTGYNAETGKYYYDYCDLDSLVKMYLVQQLSGNADAFTSSLFFYKDAGGKLFAGPIWDMEMAGGTGWDEIIDSSREFLSLRYLSEALIQIPGFEDAVKAYYQDTFRPAAQALTGSSGKVSEYAQTLSESTAMNYMLWPYVRVGNPDSAEHLWTDGTNYADVVNDLDQWLEDRISFMDKLILGTSSSDSHGGGGGGSAGAAEMAVTVEQSAHGTISVDPGKAAKGDTVTITVKPDEGYHLDKLTVTDQKGKTVSVTRSADGKYTFKMPETAVTIEADFGEGAASDDLPYTDVGRADWFHDPVAYAYEHGIMSGVSEDRFEPEGTLTRAMMVAMLWRLEGQPQPESVRSFADVPDGTWYTQAVEWAAEKGIVSGYGDDLFGPEDNITREQLAAILYRYAAEKAYDTSQGGMAAREFSDWGSVSPYADQAISWAVNAGIISGMGDNTLQPQGNATRAQAATLFMQFMENIAKS